MRSQTIPTRKVAAKDPTKLRREQVEETLKEIDQRSKKLRSPPLSTRIQQAGLTWSKRTFYLTSASVVWASVAFLALTFSSRTSS